VPMTIGGAQGKRETIKKIFQNKHHKHKKVKKKTNPHGEAGGGGGGGRGNTAIKVRSQPP